MSPRIALACGLALLLSAGVTVAAQSTRPEPAPAGADLRKLIHAIDRTRAEAASLHAELRRTLGGEKAAPKAGAVDPGQRPAEAPANLDTLGRSVSAWRKEWCGLRDELHALLRTLGPAYQGLAELDRKLEDLKKKRRFTVPPIPGDDASPRLLRHELVRMRRLCLLQKQLLFNQQILLIHLEKRMCLLQLVSHPPILPDAKEQPSIETTLEALLKNAKEQPSAELTLEAMLQNAARRYRELTRKLAEDKEKKKREEAAEKKEQPGKEPDGK